MRPKEARGWCERPEWERWLRGLSRTEQVLFCWQGQARPGGCGCCQQQSGIGTRVLGPALPFPCCHYPLGYSYSCSLGDLAVPHSEFSELEEVQARAKSSAELTTVGSHQDRGSARGGRAVRTARRCLCATVNLISGGRSRSWEVFEKGSEVTKAVLEALLAWGVTVGGPSRGLPVNSHTI